jgi:hypothetical protein
MAQKTTVTYVDDITGEDIKDGKGGPVSFALDGTEYVIDLTDKSADKFRALFQDYIAVASKVGRKTGTRGSKTSTGPSAREVRDWARSNGWEVPDRGRIPKDIQAAFNKAR